MCFFDLETTGLNIVTDRIVEVSVIRVNTDHSKSIFTQRVNPTIPIPAKSTAIHGITDEMVANEPAFREIAPRLHSFIQNGDLSGYNALKFDVPFLAEEFHRAEIDFNMDNRRVIDVQNIFHKMESRTLSAAFKFYCSKNLVNAHSAEADALATLEILEAMLERYDGAPFTDQKGNVSYPVVNKVGPLSDFSYFYKTADLAGHIVFNEQNQETFNFGKYKGDTVENVFTKEPQYYDWMMRSDFPLSTKKVITNIKLRQFNMKNKPE